MTFLDQLHQSAQRSVVLLHRFLLTIGKFQSGVHAFFEGKTDDSFYGLAIRTHCSSERKLATYHCGSKRRVYEARKEIMGHMPQGHVAIFFVDRDLDWLIPIAYTEFPDIYVTDFYSIENHLVSEEMLECTWGQLFRQETDPIALTPILGKFRAGLNQFYLVMCHVMAWVVVQRRAGSKLNLDDSIRLQELFDIDDALNLRLRVKESLIYETLNKMAACTTTDLQNREATKVANQFASSTPKSFVRGRFELWFFVEFLRAFRKWGDKHGYRVQAKIELGITNALDVLGPRARPPTSLSEFLQRHLGNLGATTPPAGDSTT